MNTVNNEKMYLVMMNLLNQKVEVKIPWCPTRIERNFISCLGFYDTFFESYEYFLEEEEEKGENKEELLSFLNLLSEAVFVLYKNWECLLKDNIDLCKKDLESIIFALKYYAEDLRSVEEDNESTIFENYCKKFTIKLKEL